MPWSSRGRWKTRTGRVGGMQLWSVNATLGAVTELGVAPGSAGA